LKSIRLANGSTYFSQQHNALRSDAAAAAFLHVHQQLGALALGTNPSNGNTLTLDINGTNVVLTFVSSIGSASGNVLIGASAAATVANVVALLQNPTVTTSTGVALGVIGSTNTILVQYLGWALSTGGTTVTPFSLNTSTSSPLTSFSASTTATGGSWTAQTMQLYVEPGTYYVGTTRVLFLGGSTPTFTAPSSHPRIDLVTADSSGTIAVVTGTENASPVPPSYPANKLVLAEIYHVVSETALYDVDNQQTGQGYVYNDVRPAQAPPYINSQAQIAAGVVILDPGSEAQGDILYYNGSAWVLLSPGTAGYALVTGGAGANPSYAPLTVTHTNGISSRSTTGSQTIAHGLGRTPANIKMFGGFSSISDGFCFCSGDYNGTQAAYQMFSNQSGLPEAQGTGFILVFQSTTAGGNFTASITFDATNIYLTWTTNNAAFAVNFEWEAS
jgi:hypothetical protein